MHGTAERDSADEAVTGTARQVAASRWGDRGARVGLAACGLVYLVLAYLVARVALGALGRAGASNAASGTGVASAIAGQPGGRVALVVLAAGLLLFALFCLLDAILHHDDESSRTERWTNRGLSVWTFLVYSLFCAYCLKIAVSPSSPAGSASRQDRRDTQLSAQVLRWPGGPVWLGLLAAALFVIAGFLVGRGLQRSFRGRLDEQAMSPRAWRLAMVTGVGGYLGRAVLSGAVAGCILHAAWENDPRTGQGVDGAIRIIADSTAGPALLWIVVLGLGLYGVYMLVEARFRHV